MQVKAVYDWQVERGQKRAEELGCDLCGYVDAILGDPEITSVIICSETARHRELIEKSGSGGQAHFAEKPLATTGEEAAAMRDAISKAGVIFQTGFFQRSSPAMRLSSGKSKPGTWEPSRGCVTPIVTAVHWAGWFDTDWRWIADKNEAGGGGYADLGAHSLDIILWVMIRPAAP